MSVPLDRPHVAVIARERLTGVLVVLMLRDVPEGEAMASAEPSALAHGLEFLTAYRCSEVSGPRPG